MPVESLITSVVASMGAKGLEVLLSGKGNMFARIAETMTDQEKDFLIAAARNPTQKIKYIGFNGGCSLEIGDNRYSGEDVNDCFKSMLLEGIFNPYTSSPNCAIFYLSVAGRLIANEL